MAKKSKMKTKSKPTIKEQYMKEYLDFYKRLGRIEARGYKLPDRFRPSIPKNIGGRELERIKNKNNLDYIYDKATFYDVESDRLVSGRKGREIERSRAGKKGARTRKERKQEAERPFFTDAVLREVENIVENATPTYANPYGKPMLQNLLYEQIAEQGREAVAQKMNSAESWVKESTRIVVQDSNQYNIESNFNAILVLLTNRALSPREMHEAYAFYVDEGWN